MQNSSNVLGASQRKLVLEVIRTLTELERRKTRNRLQAYVPYERQREFHAAGRLHRERLFMAGNQLGKTWAGGFECAMHLTGRYPDWWRGRRYDRPVRLWAAGVTAESTRDNPQRILLGSPAVRAAWGTGTVPGDSIENISMARNIPDAVDSIAVRHASGGTSSLAFKAYGMGREKWQRNTQRASWFGEDKKEKKIRQEFEALQKSTDPNMIVRMEANRVWAIQNHRQVIFNIEDSPTLTGEAPIYRFHREGYYAVKDHDDTIVRESQRFGVNPDLVRAIMYVENADGHRFGGDQLAQRLGIEDTILPMNINPEKWGGIGGVSKSEFYDPEKNIRAGVALIKEIQDRIVDPTPAKVGSIWQFSGAEKVRENGAKIERVMRERLWERFPEEGMSGPHVP